MSPPSLIIPDPSPASRRAWHGHPEAAHAP